MQQKLISRIASLLVAIAVGLVGWDIMQVSAQTVSPTTPSSTTVQSALQSLGVTTPATTTGVPPPAGPVMVQPSVSPYTQTIAPALPPAVTQLPTSTLELLYSQRAGQPLQQFGYDIFGVGSPVNI